MSEHGGKARIRGSDPESKRNHEPVEEAEKSRKKKDKKNKKDKKDKKGTRSGTSGADKDKEDRESGESSGKSSKSTKSSKSSKSSKSTKSRSSTKNKDNKESAAALEEPVSEDVRKRREAEAVQNAWWEARRQATLDWGCGDKASGLKCLIIGGPDCGARTVIQYLVGETCCGVPDNELDGLIISPHERADPVLRTRYPKMRWVKFFDKEAVTYWRAFNARGKPFYVLVSGGILSHHIEDELMETIDTNRGTLIIHQMSPNLLDTVYSFDRVLANADRKAIYPMCQSLIPDVATWERLCEAMIRDSRLFVDIVAWKKTLGTFKI